MEDAYEGLKLNLGCGRIKWDGWIGCDLNGADVACDIRKLPYGDESIAAIAAIHVIEHFYSWEVPHILHEWKRVLKPGGKLVLELPCMNKILGHIGKCYQENRPIHSLFWNALWGEQHEGRVEMCHKYGYSQEQMLNAFENVGFRNVVSTEPRYHFPVRDMRIEGTK